MTEQQRVKIMEKSRRRCHAVKPAWIKAPVRIRKKRIAFWNSSPQKECGFYSYYRDANFEWKCHFVSNRTKRFGVVHDRAVKLSLT